jgi:non-ribosomal peptide synthetase component E (peptide arylation enzyme)
MKPESWIDIPFLALPALIRDHAKERTRHLAVVQDERNLDYAALDAYMDRIAASLQRDGLKAKDAIAICASTSIDYLTVFLAALRAGVAGRAARALLHARNHRDHDRGFGLQTFLSRQRRR